MFVWTHNFQKIIIDGIFSKQLDFEELVANGIIAFYVAVVAVVGKFLRGSFGGGGKRVIYEEMPDTQDIVDLCEGVYIARK